MRPYLRPHLLTLLLLTGCQPWSVDEDKKDADRPQLPNASVNQPATGTPSAKPTADAPAPVDAGPADPHLALLPLPKDSPQAEANFADVLSHPWVARQTKVTTLTRVMVDDIRLLQQAHHQLTEQRKVAHMDTPSLDEESELMMQSLDILQKPLYMLGLKYPPELYSVLNIPATNTELLPAPVPFQIYKRVHLFTTHRGNPVFVDLRVFPLSHVKNATEHDRTILNIVDWHLNLLKGGRNDYVRYASTDCVAFVGNGDHDTTVQNPSHGMATTDRTLMLGFIEHTDKLYVLYAEGPRDEMIPYETTFLEILARPMVKIPKETK